MHGRPFLFGLFFRVLITAVAIGYIGDRVAFILTINQVIFVVFFFVFVFLYKPFRTIWIPDHFQRLIDHSFKQNVFQTYFKHESYLFSTKKNKKKKTIFFSADEPVIHVLSSCYVLFIKFSYFIPLLSS